MKTVTVNFTFPLVNAKLMPVIKLFANLFVTAHYTIGRLDKVLEIKITNIAYVKNGETFGANIDTLLQLIAPDLYNEICEAAKNTVESFLTQ